MSALTFLLDVGASTGLGHWHRCLALAVVLRADWEIEFVTPPLAAALAASLDSGKIHHVIAPDWTTEGVGTALNSFSKGRSAFVLDLIDTPLELVRNLRSHSRVVTVGGAGQGRSEAGLRVDGMIPRPGFADDFHGQKLLVGPEYVMLRPGFSPGYGPVSAVVRRMLIALGGDAKGEGLVVAATLAAAYPELAFDVVVGPLASPGAAGPLVRIWQDPPSMPSLMRTADLAVCSGGMTANELCRMGVPIILLPQNDLQRAAAAAYRMRGVALLVSDETSLIAAVRSLADAGEREAMRRAGQALIDGGGVERVAAAISTFLHKTI